MSNPRTKNNEDKMFLQVDQLFLAVQSGDTETATQLINSGVDLDFHDKKGKTVLDYAIETQRFTLIDLLLKHGAKAREHARFLNDFLSKHTLFETNNHSINNSRFTHLVALPSKLGHFSKNWTQQLEDFERYDKVVQELDKIKAGIEARNAGYWDYGGCPM